MDISSLIRLAKQFRDARKWKQFHTPKDSVLALISESGELVEHLSGTVQLKWMSI